MARSRRAAIGSRCAAFALLALFAVASHGADRFVVSSDGEEVTDSNTRLVWRRCSEGMHWDGKTCTGRLVKYKYAGARSAAESAAKNTRKAWRIPTREELVTLYDAKLKRAPRIDGSMFPKATNGPFWATRAGTDDNLNAWLVNFRNDRVSGYAGQKTFPLRLVRAPASRASLMICFEVVPRTIESSSSRTFLLRNSRSIAFSLRRTEFTRSACPGMMKVRPM